MSALTRQELDPLRPVLFSFLTFVNAAVNHHRQDPNVRLFLAALLPTGWRRTYDIGERSAFEDLGSRVADVEKHLVERPVLGVAVDQDAQLFRIAKRRQRAINQPDDFAEIDLGRSPPPL